MRLARLSYHLLSTLSPGADGGQSRVATFRLLHGTSASDASPMQSGCRGSTRACDWLPQRELPASSTAKRAYRRSPRPLGQSTLARSIQTIVAHAGDTLSYLIDFLLGFLHGHDGGLASQVDTAASLDRYSRARHQTRIFFGTNPRILWD